MKEFSMIIFQKKDKKNELPSLEGYGIKIIHNDRIGAVLSIEELDLEGKELAVIEGDGILYDISKDNLKRFVNRRYYIHYIKGVRIQGD